MSSSNGAGEGLDRRLLMIASVVVLGAIMSILDTTVVNVALNTLAQDFDAPLSTIQWVVTGYTLALATVIPITGWAADRFGTKRLYMLSIGLFLMGSLLVGHRLVGRVADRLPHPAGPRRRHADAGRHDDPHARGRAAARRARDGDHRRADAARPDPRSDPRRLAGRRDLLALDLLHQPADRHRGADRLAADPGQGLAAARPSPRRGRLRAAVARPRADDLRPRRVRVLRRLRRLRGLGSRPHGPGAVHRLHPGTPCARRTRCSTCACSRTARSRRPRARSS